MSHSPQISIKNDDQCRESATQWVSSALQHFRLVMMSDRPLLSAIQGLEAVLSAVRTDADLAETNPGAHQEACDIVAAILPLIVDLAGISIPDGRIRNGLGCAAALLAGHKDEFHTDRILHSGLLLADLKSLFCRTEINSRGDRLIRALTVRMAWDGPRSSLQALQ